MKSHPSLMLRLAAPLMAALLGAHGAASALPDADTSPRLGEAMEAYERCEWQQAFEQLAGLADGGHAEAARIALLMARFGPTMYAARFDTSAQQRQHWLGLATLPARQLARNSANYHGR